MGVGVFSFPEQNVYAVWALALSDVESIACCAHVHVHAHMHVVDDDVVLLVRC
jgi:hypothetical protein